MRDVPSGERHVLSRSVMITSLVGAVLHPLSLAAEQGLFLTGYSATYASGIPMEQEGGINSKALCGSSGVSELQKINQAVLERVSDRIGQVGIPSVGEWQSEAQATQTELCQGDASFHLEPQAITYSSCRMTVDQHSTLIDMRLPTAEVQGAMDVADFWKAEVMRIPLYLPGESNAAQTEQSTGDMNWSGPGDTRQIAGHPATRWDFAYSATMNVGGATGMSMNMQTDGFGYFSRDVPGFEILDALYRKFLDGISFEEGGGSFFGGMMKTWVEVLDRGLPMHMDQTTKTNMGGMGMGGGGSRIVMKINSIRLVGLPSDLCTRELTPDYFAVTDAGAGLSGMSVTPGTPGESDSEAGGGPLGGLLEMMNSAGEQGFAVPGQQRATIPGTQQVPAADPAGQAVPQAPAGSAPSANVGPSSSDLTTANMTQSVQLHLEALGYPVGNTNGELDTDTIIAISQFQAERGMDVTGEVTPQLLGILGAAVDAQ